MRTTGALNCLFHHRPVGSAGPQNQGALSLRGWYRDDGLATVCGAGQALPWGLTAPTPSTHLHRCSGPASSACACSPCVSLWHTAWPPAQVWSAALPFSVPWWASQGTPAEVVSARVWHPAAGASDWANQGETKNRAGSRGLAWPTGFLLAAPWPGTCRREIIYKTADSWLPREWC